MSQQATPSDHPPLTPGGPQAGNQRHPGPLSSRVRPARSGPPGGNHLTGSQPTTPIQNAPASDQQHPPHTPRVVYVATAIAALGGLLFGYDTGVISGALLFIRTTFHLSSTLQEVVTSMVLVGAVVGAAASGVLADRFGRRHITIGSAVIFVVGTVGIALAPTLTVLLVGRLVVGLAIGTASFVTPLYISEIAPPALRGSLVAVNQLALAVGIVLAYVVDYVFATSGAWRWMFGVGVIPGIGLGVGMFLLPDSPHWLMSVGRHQSAQHILLRIRGTTDVQQEVDTITASLHQQNRSWHLLWSPALRMPLLVGVGLALFQQLTGVNTVIYYAPTIFRSAGFHSASTAILATFAVGIVNVAFTGVAVWLLDRVGRRPLLLGGLIGMTVSLIVLGAGFALHAAPSVVGIITIGSLMVFIAAFAIGLGPVFWLLIAEIYPLQVRGRAMSVAAVTNWGANLLVTLTFLTLVGVLGRSGTFWLFAGMSVIAWVFSWKFVPETKGRTLKQIEAEMHPTG